MACKVILRVDDFPGTKPNEFNKHNLDSFKKFDEILCKNGFENYILGIIPRYMNLESIKFFSNNKRIVCALHGINHPEDKQDEFEGMSQNIIETHILNVKSILELSLGYSIVDYIPPHNCINQNTINALVNCGFENVYGGPETDLTLDFSGFKEKDIRWSCKPYEYGRCDELLSIGAAEEIACSNKKNIYLTLHFPWEVNTGLQYLNAFLEKIS